MNEPAIKELDVRWLAAWPQALITWSPYVQLAEPWFCYDEHGEVQGQRLGSTIARIRFSDLRVMVNMELIQQHHLEYFPVEILAHEVGHHLFVPGNLTNHARMIAALSSSMSDLDQEDWHLAANLYADLLINDHLKRTCGLRMDEIYRRLGKSGDRLWALYLRIYEELWRLPRGDLAPLDDTAPDTELEADAFLISRIIRHYAVRWLAGVRRFAAIIHPYLAARQRKVMSLMLLFNDLRRSTRGDEKLDGFTTIGDEDGDAELDATFDATYGNPFGTATNTTGHPPLDPGRKSTSGKGQQREPFRYHEILRAMGVDVDRATLVWRWYREQALPRLLPFPRARAIPAHEPHPEGFAPWELSDDFDALDIAGSLSLHGVLIPGITTVRRIEGAAPGHEPAHCPIDLDIYIDCSGSMPDPAHNVSHLALAGTILTLSALRAGARVQATLWSGTNQFITTKGFIRDEAHLLRVVCGFLGGATAFPLHVLRTTYTSRSVSDPPAHVVVISDDGVDTMLQKDELGTPGATIVTTALARARAGGTLVLNVPHLDQWAAKAQLEKLGWRIHAVTDWANLTTFAQTFVRQTYQPQANR